MAHTTETPPTAPARAKAEAAETAAATRRQRHPERHRVLKEKEGEGGGRDPNHPPEFRIQTLAKSEERRATRVAGPGERLRGRSGGDPTPRPSPV